MTLHRSTRLLRCAEAVALCLAAAALFPSCAAAPRGKIDWAASRAASSRLGYASAAAWESDLAYLERTLEERHPDPWHAVSRAEFSAALRGAAAAPADTTAADTAPAGAAPAAADTAPAIPDVAAGPGAADAAPDEAGQSALALGESRAAAVARALALVGEGHTRLIPQLELARGLPLSIERGSDGYYVLAALPGRDADDPALDPALGLLGARLVSIDGLPMAEVEALLGPYASAENELGAREEIARLLPRAGILVAAGIARAGDARAVVEAERDGVRITCDVPFDESAFAGGTGREWRGAFRASETTPAPTLPRDGAFWFEYLPDSRTMYFQYNSCSETKERPFGKFCAELFEAIGREKPDRLVVDLRENGGGNSALFTFSFMPRIKASYLNAAGRLFVLIGPKVFSSGVFAAHELRSQTRAVFLGEPTGQGANHYGYTGYFSLPETGLAIMHSTRYWELERGSTADSIRPDVEVPADVPAMLAGRDPVAEAAIAYGR